MLERSTDRKTANLANKAGKQAVIKNAFGLPSGTGFSCPGATSICESICYAGKLERVFPGMRKVMLRNWDRVKDASYLDLRFMLGQMMEEFEAECDKRGAEKVFRIHHDGDFFSVDYARAWGETVRENHRIQFWAYTRSFTPTTNVIPALADIPNLSLYLSVDSENEEHAAEILADYPDVRVAALGKTFADGTAIVRGVRQDNKPGARCPENAKQIPLITTGGGACFSCGLCVKAKADVRFSISKK